MRVLALIALCATPAAAGGWNAAQAQSALLACDEPGLACAVRVNAMCVTEGGRGCDATTAQAADQMMRTAYADTRRAVEQGENTAGMAASDAVARLVHTQSVWLSQRDSRCGSDLICLTGLNTDRAKYLVEQT